MILIMVRNTYLFTFIFHTPWDQDLFTYIKCVIHNDISCFKHSHWINAYNYLCCICSNGHQNIFKGKTALLFPSLYLLVMCILGQMGCWNDLDFSFLHCQQCIKLEEEYLLQMPRVGSTTHYIFLVFDITGCLADMEYQLCGSQLTCTNFSRRNNSFCGSGCFCSNKYVLEDGMCIHPDTCPGKFYCTWRFFIQAQILSC